MAELNQNLIYLVVSFFGLCVIGFIYLIAINGSVLPQFINTLNIINENNPRPIDAASKSSVLAGFTQVDVMLKILIPGLFVAALAAVIIFILYRKEQESYQQ